jgi:hypothetical protein
MPSKSETVERPNRENRRHPDTAVEHLWTLDEVSAYLREAQRTTRRRIARGELPGVVRLPNSRRLLFDPPTVRGYVAAHLNGAK